MFEEFEGQRRVISISYSKKDSALKKPLHISPKGTIIKKKNFICIFKIVIHEVQKKCNKRKR